MRFCRRYFINCVEIRMLLLLFDWVKMTSSVGNITLYLPSTSQNDIERTFSALGHAGIEIHNNTFVFLAESNISSLIDFYSLLNSTHAKYHVSYLPSALTRRMRKFAASRQKYLWKVDEKSCHVSFTDQADSRFCTHDYFTAIRELTRYFHSATAAVLTTNSKCSHAIGQKLINFYNSTNQHKAGVGIRSLEHFVIPTEGNLSDKITKLLYKLKMKSIDFVINILESPVVDLLFEAAMRYSLTHLSTTWLTIEHLHYNLDPQNSPWQWLNLRASQEDEEWKMNTLLETVKSTLSTFQSVTLNDTRQWALQMTQKLQTNIDEIKCNSTNQIIEVLARDPSTANQIKWAKAFVWSTEQKSIQTFPETDLLVTMMRRSSESVTLKVVTIIDPPFTMYAKHLYNPSEKGTCEQGVVCRTAVIGLPENDPNKWVKSCCVGMVIDLLMLVTGELHFDPYVYIVEDGFYGGKVKNSSEWNGLVQDIRLRKADLAIAALTTTADRFEVVDFCVPYWRIDLGIMISTMMDSLSFINWEFLEPLSVQLRLWILVTFILGTILIYVLENQHLVLQRITDRTVFPRYQWREGFSYFSGLTFQRDLGGKNPQRYGARVTAVAFAFGMVIIMTTYTAVLTASKVSQANSNPFLGFKDARVTQPTPDFKYATVSHTSMESFFKNSQDEVHKRMYQFMLNYNVNQSSEGIESIGNAGTINAFIHEWPFLQYHASKDPHCNLKIYGDPIHQGGYAFSVPKKSPWKHLFSQSIIRMKENDVIDKIYNKWFPASCSQDAISTQYEGVEINYFGGLIFILGVCLLISIVLLGLELFIYRHHRRVINPIQDKVQVWRELKYQRRNAIIDPNDISYLQSLHKKGLIKTESTESDGASKTNESSSDDDISEGEEELIRMRLGRCLPVTSTPIKKTELNQETTSMRSFTAEINTFNRTKRRQSSATDFLALDLDALNALKRFETTLEIAEEENSDDSNSLKSRDSAETAPTASKDSNGQANMNGNDNDEGFKSMDSQMSVKTYNGDLKSKSDDARIISTRIDDIFPGNDEDLDDKQVTKSDTGINSTTIEESKHVTPTLDDYKQRTSGEVSCVCEDVETSDELCKEIVEAIVNKLTIRSPVANNTKDIHTSESKTTMTAAVTVNDCEVSVKETLSPTIFTSEAQHSEKLPNEQQEKVDGNK